MAYRLTATHALDIAYDAGASRPRIVTTEEWAGNTEYLLTFGEVASRKTVTLRPDMTEAMVMALVQEAMAPKAAVSFVTHSQDPIIQPIVPAPITEAPKKRGRPKKHVGP